MITPLSTLTVSAAPSISGIPLPSPNDLSAFALQLDGIIRGNIPVISELTRNAEPALLGALLAATCILTGLFGLTLGAVHGWRQALASAIKLPVVYISSMFVTLPALYVAGAYMGCKLSVSGCTALFLTMLTANGILLASVAPIILLFSMNSDYHFQKILTCGFLCLAGVLAAWIMLKGLIALAGPGSSPGLLFIAWLLLYGFVGTQTAWQLRPFLGEPSLKFQWYRSQSTGMNFTTALIHSVVQWSRKPTEIQGQRDGVAENLSANKEAQRPAI